MRRVVSLRTATKCNLTEYAPPPLGAQLLFSALEAGLVEQYMADSHPSLPDVAERSAQNMRDVWWTLHPEDNTLKVVLDLVLAAMHIELFDWGLRHNAIRAVEAARSDVLLDILCGRGHLNYALLTMMALADWGPGANGRCSDRARKLFVDNCSSGVQGKGQPVDLNTEECIRELKSAGARARLTLPPTSASVHKHSRVRCLRRAHVQQGKRVGRFGAVEMECGAAADDPEGRIREGGGSPPQGTASFGERLLRYARHDPRERMVEACRTRWTGGRQRGGAACRRSGLAPPRGRASRSRGTSGPRAWLRRLPTRQPPKHPEVPRRRNR